MKIPMGKQVFKTVKKLMKYLYNDNKVEDYLNNPDNLMNILFPDHELQRQYGIGFFET